MKNVLKKCMSCVLALAIVISFMPADGVFAAKKTTLKTKKLSMYVGEAKKIKIKNSKKGFTYTYKSSKPKVAKVNKKGKVTALKKGNAKITVREKGKGKMAKSKKLGVCKVYVSQNKVIELPKIVYPTDNPQNTAAPAGDTTDIPATDMPKPTVAPAYGTTSYTDKDLVNGTDLYLGKLMQYGGICKVSAKVLQNSGSDKDITVSYYGEYLYFECNNQYINKSTIDEHRPLEEGSQTQVCPSGSETTLEFTFELPKYTKDFNLKLDLAGAELKDLTVETNPVADSNYPEMVANSCRSTGNNARIKKAIEKAKNGEDVTLAYLGGSITEGFAASETNNAECYAETSYNEFKDTFAPGDGKNVHFINAGMSGTSSRLGIIRYQRDILNHMEKGEVPDILFIDFAVNDGNDADTYESVIRTALSQGSAVVLMFVLYTRGSGKENDYAKIGEYYDIAMVSPASGQSAAAKDKAAFDDWFYWNHGGDMHPDVCGHRYMADCIMNMFMLVDAEETEEDNIVNVADITPKSSTGDAFTGMKTLEQGVDLSKHPSVHSLTSGGFSGKDLAQPTLQYEKDGVNGLTWFPNAWAHTASSENDSFKAEIECNSIIVAYKKAGSGFGTAECYLDGNKVGELIGTAPGAWNYAEMNTVLSGSEVAVHTLEIRMKDGDEEKPFTIYAIGYANKNE